MCRVRSSSLSRRVRSCFLMTSDSYSSSEKQPAMPVCSCVAHAQPVEIERRLRPRRRAARWRAARRGSRAPSHTPARRIGIGARRKIDLRPRDVQEAERIAGGELARLVGADDVVRNGGNRGGRFGRRSQGPERMDRSHPAILAGHSHETPRCQGCAGALAPVLFGWYSVRLGWRGRGGERAAPTVAASAASRSCEERRRAARPGSGRRAAASAGPTSGFTNTPLRFRR